MNSWRWQAGKSLKNSGSKFVWLVRGLGLRFQSGATELCGVFQQSVIFPRRGKQHFFRGDAKKIMGGWNFSFYQRSSSIKVSLPYNVAFCLKSPIFIIQRAYILKNGVEFCQQTKSDNRTGVATLYDLVRLCRRYVFRLKKCDRTSKQVSNQEIWHYDDRCPGSGRKNK